MKSKILAITAVIVAAGCIVSVACSKGETEQNIPASFAENSAKTLSDEELLGMEFIVATSNGELKEGDELELTFDKEKFLTAYEYHLITETGNTWLAEDIVVFMHRINETTVCPVLKISAFDMVSEKSHNSFFVLNACATLGSTINYVFVGANAIGAKCIGSGCCANEPGACELLEHGGMYCCTTCKCMSSQNGNCQKETFTMPEVVIISKAINFI